MISLLEVAERARSGQRMDDKEWGLSLYKKLQDLTMRHDLRQKGPERFYEVDDDYADSLFQAAVDLLVETGVYCTTTHRVIRFSEDEVREAAREAPSEVKVGEGHDQRTFRRRELEDHRPPSIDVSGHGPWSDEMIPLPIVVRELARHRRVDLLEGYMFAKIDGHEVHGKPLCGYAARRAIERIRDGLTMADRRGLAITYYPVRTDAFALVAPLDQERGLRKTDGVLLTILPDLVVEEDLIAAALIYNEWGCYGQCGGTGVGPFGGEVEGRMIESTAGPLAGWMVYRDTLLTAGGAGGQSSARKARSEETGKDFQREKEQEWRSFAVQKALRRNTNQVYYSIVWGESTGLDNLVSEEYLLRVALSSIRNTILGNNFRIGTTNPPTYTSWVVETSDAAIELNIRLEDYEEFAERIRKEKLSGELFPADLPDKRMLIYENRWQEFLAAGLKAYDWFMQTPTDEYLKNERKARKYLRDIGLDLL
jgi:hypothetical protein